MKKLILAFSLVIITLSGVQAQSKKTVAKAKKAPVTTQAKKEVVETRYELEANNTAIKWTGKKVAGSHNGKISAENGVFVLNNGQLASGLVVINMNSITCDDIEDKGKNDYLVSHLKNEDFFNTVAHPHAMLEIQKSVKQKDGTYLVSANLIIKGQSHPINFKAKISTIGNQLTASCKLKFDRTKYDIKYGSGMIGTAQDKLIKDEVELEITLAAIKK